MRMLMTVRIHSFPSRTTWAFREDNLVRPHGWSWERITLVRSRAVEKDLHGGASIHPTSRPRFRSWRISRSTCLLVRSARGPSLISQARALKPSRRTALAMPPAPAKKSPKYKVDQLAEHIAPGFRGRDPRDVCRNVDVALRRLPPPADHPPPAQASRSAPVASSSFTGSALLASLSCATGRGLQP